MLMKKRWNDIEFGDAVQNFNNTSTRKAPMAKTDSKRGANPKSKSAKIKDLAARPKNSVKGGKLIVSSNSDVFEHEADAVAGSVMR